MPKPTLIVIYNDPNNKSKSRIVYQPNDADIDTKKQYQVSVEMHGVDGLGNERWAPAQTRFPYEITLAEVVAAMARGEGKVDKSSDGRIVTVDMSGLDFGPKS